MFCDVVGSTTIAEMLDPEDYQDLLYAYRALCARHIERGNGELAQYVGDGILAHYGYPAAREDGARSAVNAALAICSEAPRLSEAMQGRYGVTLAVRIGINTGIVVTHAAPGAGVTLSGGPEGSMLNIAARLHEIAPPNGVVISDATLRLVQGQFIVRTLGARRLKGLEREVVAYQVTEASSARSLFQARAVRGLSPIVGRDEQLAQLGRNWFATLQGQARSVLVSGEPGIGKSRLIHEFQKRVEQGVAVQITCQCNAQYQSTAFHPVAAELARVFSVRPGDAWETLVAKVQAAMTRLGVTDALTAERLGLVLAEYANVAVPSAPQGASPQGASKDTVKGTPQEASGAAPGAEVKGRAMDAVASYIRTVAAKVPLLLIFEDVHWADPSTLELLYRLCAVLGSTPVLILASCRTDRVPDAAVDERIELERISPDECKALIEMTAGEAGLSAPVISQLVQRSDGVPLFAEELTRSVGEGLSAGAAPGDGIGGAAVPASLRDTLMERLDRLGPAKVVAQFASAIGRAFGLDLLCAVMGGSLEALKAQLDRLAEAGLVYAQPGGLAGGDAPAFEFKHELVRNVAYESLVRTARRDIHRRIADLMRGRFAEEGGRHPELVAYHCTEAGLAAQAVDLWELAGRRAIRNSASLEAVAHLSRALALIETLPETRARKRKELGCTLPLRPRS